MNNAAIPVGLVGFGLAGSVFHAPLIRACKRLELAAVLTSRDAPNAVGSFDELMEQCELVVIASPNSTHFAIARRALEADKHVVVDKPFTVAVDEADQLMQVAAERSRMISVFHNRRWDADYLTVQQIIPSLGNVMLMEASWDRFRPLIKSGWRELSEPGAGLLNDLGPHLVDQALQLFGMPDAIQADIVVQRSNASVDDYFDLTLHYERRRVRLRSSTLVAAPRPRFAVHGTEGSYVKNGLDRQETQLKAGLDPTDRDFGLDPCSGVLVRSDGVRTPIETARGNYLAYYDAVAAAILDGAPVPVTAEEARTGLVIIDLARRASAEGQRIQVPAASSQAK